ncbi:CAS/CSE protein [Boletus edulis BED1]|uniref:CAS/CSE protein n=1 Tax=Boletus edulis BED1 TaxID=1328754 RepID=A0AAD4G7T1_BOLED|nr:CAS/CSE protein [Boletus edulis BED1]KAF8428023.1 CAS/CSE protein [Boletus edulis BED1]
MDRASTPNAYALVTPEPQHAPTLESFDVDSEHKSKALIQSPSRHFPFLQLPLERILSHHPQMLTACQDPLIMLVRILTQPCSFTLTPVYQQVLQRLVAILGIISKNPSNPSFDQYIFESILALTRFVVHGAPATLPTFEQALFGPFTVIPQRDINQYIPYIFQVLAQMLSLHTTGVPAEYRSLLPFCSHPRAGKKWSIPGFVKLLRAFLARDAQEMVRAGQFERVLATVQQRLVRVNERRVGI